MAALDWHVRRAAGVTLVELLVTSDTAERVRIETELAPVWPPRRQGRPVEGWDDTVYEGIVEEARRLALGFASPAPPAEPPATIAESEPVDDAEPDGSVTAEDIVRTLGDGAPPRDAVPMPEEPTFRHDDSGSDSVDAHTAAEPRPATAEPQRAGNGTETLAVAGTQRQGEDGDRQSPLPGGDGVATAGDGDETAGNGVATTSDGVYTTADRSEEEAVEAWLDAVESRAATAERLASVTAAGEARTAIADAGGMEGVRELAAQLEADRQQLDAVHARQRSVADRLEGVELPLATLERLA